MAFLESMAHIATTVAAVATILSPAAMASGIAPRLGPGRAIALALRSRFGAVGTRSSHRDAEVKKLRALTTNAARDQYCVVMGPKGVGEFEVMYPTGKVEGVATSSPASRAPPRTASPCGSASRRSWRGKMS